MQLLTLIITGDKFDVRTCMLCGRIRFETRSAVIYSVGDFCRFARPTQASALP
jgi:hypothetical protein